MSLPIKNQTTSQSGSGNQNTQNQSITTGQNTITKPTETSTNSVGNQGPPPPPMKQITQTPLVPSTTINISDPNIIGQTPQAPPPPYQPNTASISHLPSLQQAKVIQTGTGPMTKQYAIGGSQLRPNTPS